MANPNSKELILSAAERIMSEKGMNATISEIASEAGVFDSHIYHYFKNKEDLMFSVTKKRNRKMVEELKIQMEGIREPISKLSKLIWWQLYRLQTHKDFSKIILFHCRARRNYYRHASHLETMRELRNIFTHIIDDGISEGVFRKDLNRLAIWKIVFGVMDLLNIINLMNEEPVNVQSDLDAIMELLIPMLMFKTNKVDKKNEKAARIMRSAESVFAQKGYEGASVRDITKKAAIAESTVYDYFKSKEDILFSAIQEGFQDSERSFSFKDHLKATHTQLNLKTPLDKINRFIRYFFYLGILEPDFALMFVAHGIYNPRFYTSKAYPVYKNYLKSLLQCLDEGKNNGSIRLEVNNRVFVNMVLGAFSFNIGRWFLPEPRYDIDKMKEINALIDLFIRSITP